MPGFEARAPLSLDLVITQISARRVDGVRKGYESTPPNLERQARLTLLKAQRTSQVRRAS